MAEKIALILGYGRHVGIDTAQAFRDRGYKLAVVSRSNAHVNSADDYLHIQADLSDPSSIQTIFSRVRKELGHPSVVIYNGRAFPSLRCELRQMIADDVHSQLLLVL